MEPACDEHRYYVFDGDGRLMDERGKRRASVSRRSVPGEINQLWVDPLDRLHVYDASDREVVLSAHGGTLTTKTGGRAPFSVLAVGDKRQLHHIPGAYHPSGEPFHVLDDRSRLERSFGASGNPAVVAGGGARAAEPGSAGDSSATGAAGAVGAASAMSDYRPWLTKRSIARHDESSFWSARVEKYRLDLWTHDGELVRQLQRDLEWLQPGASSGTDPPEWPENVVAAIHQDRDGYLWVMLHRLVDASAEPAIDWQRRYDTVFEVLDPDAGLLLATLQVDDLFDGWVDGMLRTLREGPDGNYRLELWEAGLCKEPGPHKEPGPRREPCPR